MYSVTLTKEPKKADEIVKSPLYIPSLAFNYKSEKKHTVLIKSIEKGYKCLIDSLANHSEVTAKMILDHVHYTKD